MTTRQAAITFVAAAAGCALALFGFRYFDEGKEAPAVVVAPKKAAPVHPGRHQIVMDPTGSEFVILLDTATGATLRMFRPKDGKGLDWTPMYGYSSGAPSRVEMLDMLLHWEHKKKQKEEAGR